MNESEISTSLRIVDGDHSRGLADAPVTILVYGDYECPDTRQFELSLARLRRRESDTFRSVFRHFPLREVHPHAQTAAEAAEAVYAFAGADPFWTMHDTLFANQERVEPPDLERHAAAAAAAGASAAVRGALETGQFAERVERDIRSGGAAGVRGTPS